jgi:hypothetical protein
MVENTAPVPQTALASVNQSARWNSRIMAKGFSVRGAVIGRASLEWLVKILPF